MKDNETKIHPLVKAGSALGALALAVTTANCRVSPTTPEVTPTNSPSTLTVEPPEPPVGFEPSTPTSDIILTPTGVETPTSTESGVSAFREPTLEELVVPTGEGGPLPEYAQEYYNVMDRVKVDVAQKVGVDPNKVKTRYWDNSNSQDAFGWMLYYQIEGGGVIWPLKPDGALADYPAYFEGEVQPDGSLINLRIDSDYDNWVVAGEKNTAAIFGGSLPVIADSPIDISVNGVTKAVYSRWIRPGGQPVDYAQEFLQWHGTPGVLAPTPEWVNDLPQGFVPIRNENGDWGIAREVNGETVAVPGINSNENKLMLNLGDGETLDITGDINAIKIVDHESGELIFDTGERIGYVWKGDHWTEILLQINFETDGTKLNEFPQINYEDVTSGALTEAERLEAKPFPEGVQPLNNYYFDSNYGNIYPNFDPQAGYEFSTHLENFPMRFINFYKVVINGIPLRLVTLQVLNRDYSSQFIHMVTFIDSTFSEDWWNDSIQLREVPSFSLALSGDKYDYCKEGLPKGARLVCALNSPQETILKTEMQKWIIGQNIPDGLDRILFLQMTGRWY